MMQRVRTLLDYHHSDLKRVLLYRFHLIVIGVNSAAIVIDGLGTRPYNAMIEATVLALLVLNVWKLRRGGALLLGAYIFNGVTSAALLGLVAINHFATMSVLFVLLLPLTTLLFLGIRRTLVLVFLLCLAMAALLAAEARYNPSNPLIANPVALYNLAYTAAIIYLFGFLYHFAILKTYDELDAADRQKAMLLSEVHHRVKNNLNVIGSIIGLQIKRRPEGEKEQLRKTKTRIESIAMVHEMLYECEDFERIDFETYMKRLSQLVLGMYADNRKIVVDVHGDGAKLKLGAMVQLGIMVNELLTNSIKYAFGEAGGTVVIRLTCEKEACRFTYSDDGCGVGDPASLTQGKSLGVKLIHLAVGQLKGTLKTESPEKGLRYVVEFRPA